MRRAQCPFDLLSVWSDHSYGRQSYPSTLPLGRGAGDWLAPEGWVDGQGWAYVWELVELHAGDGHTVKCPFEDVDSLLDDDLPPRDELRPWATDLFARTYGYDDDFWWNVSNGGTRDEDEDEDGVAGF